MSVSFSIGEVARQTAVKVPTIRFYEQIGLLPAVIRSPGNRRRYRASDVRRLLFIRHARQLGFQVSTIRTLLVLLDQPDSSCRQIDSLVADHLAAIDTKIDRLVALRGELRHMLACCAGGRVAECRVVESITTCGGVPAKPD
jgi:DNA-binding transcriptional MerR regulator